MKDTFYFEGKSGQKLIILGESSIGKTLFLDVFKQLSRFRHLKTVDDFWFLDAHEQKRELINNDVFTSKRIADFQILNSDLYLIIDLNRFISKNDPWTVKRSIVTDIATRIQYKIVYDSTERKKCTCSAYDLLRKHGCICGAISPYKPPKDFL